MTFEVYRTIFTVSLILSSVMFSLSIFLFFFYDIPKLIGDLSGRNARKAIESIREHNIQSPEKSNNQRTDKISKAKFSEETTLLHDTNETDVLESILQSNETTVLSQQIQQTQPLPDFNNTENLNDLVYTPALAHVPTPPTTPTPAYNSVVEEITFIHTNEVID